MLTVIVAGGRMVRDDYVRAKFANLQDHPAQGFFMSPEAERFVAGFGKAEIFQTQKVWFRTLNLSCRGGLARANRAEVFVELWSDRVLSAFAKGREQADRVGAK